MIEAADFNGLVETLQVRTADQQATRDPRRVGGSKRSSRHWQIESAGTRSVPRWRAEVWASAAALLF